jgi:alpha-L-fucosidase
VITSKPGKLYLHVFNWPQNGLTIYGIQSKIGRASLLASHSPVTFSQKEDKSNGVASLSLKLPAQAPDPNDSVIALEFAGQVAVDPSLEQQPDGSITLPAHLSELHKSPGSEARLDSRGVMERWTHAQDWMTWNFKVNRPGAFNVELITSQQKYGQGWDGGQHVTLEFPSERLSGIVTDNGREDNPSNPYWPYVISKMGRVRFDKPGKYALSLKPDEIPADQKYGLTLVSARLVPAK